MFRLFILSRVSCAALLLAISGELTAAAKDVSFLKDVAPILLTRCAGCHGSKRAEGDFRLHTFDALTTPGESETDTIVPEAPDNSEVLVRILEEDESLRMPQEDDPLSAEEIAVIRKWIADGAAFDGTNRSAPFQSQMPPRDHPPAPNVYRHPVPVHALGFSPDGSLVALSGYREIIIREVDTGNIRKRIGGLPQRIQALRWFQDGQRLLAGGGIPGEYGELCLVDVTAGRRHTVLDTFDDVVLSVALDESNGRLLATTASHEVCCYSEQTSQLIWKSSLHSDWVTCGSFSSDGRFVATGGRDSLIKVLRAESGDLFTTFKGHQMNLGPETGIFEVHALTFAPDTPQAFSAGEGRSIRIWEPEKARAEDGSAADMEIRFFKKGHVNFVKHGSKHPVFALKALSGSVFAATGDGFVRRFDTTSLEQQTEYAGHDDWVFSLDVHPGRGLIAAGAFDGDVRIWNIETGAPVAEFVAVPLSITATALR